MAKTTEELNIKITGNSKRAKAALKQTEAAIGKVGTKAKKTGSLLKNFKQNWIGITAAVAGLVLVSKKLLAAYAVQEKAQVTLSAAMKQAGTFTEEAFQHNLDYASSLQQMTTFGDEAILGVQKMLTNFGVEGEMLDKLTEQTLNLAAAKGMDLKSAGDLVAKSVGSSTNALTRYGIKVTGAAGSTERMQEAVENISKIFGGAAKAEAETYEGAVIAMKNAFGDFQEGLGEVIADALLPLIKTLKKVFEKMDAMPKALKIVGVVFAATIAAMIAGMLLFKVTLDAASLGITVAISAAIAGIALMIANWDSVKFAFEVAWSAIKIGLLEAAAFMLEKIPVMFAPWFFVIDKVIESLNLFREEKLRTLTEMTADVQSATDAQLNIEKTGLDKIIKNQKAAAKKKKELLEGNTDDTQTEFQKQAKAAAEAAGKIKTVFNDAYTALTKIGSVFSTSFLDGITTMKSSSKDVFASMAKGFTALISGELASLAKSQAVKALAAFPNFVAMAKHGAASVAALGASGAVKAIGGSAVSKIMSAAGGADFVTSGPELLLVGDNPSGRENVRVTPSEQGESGGGPMISIGNLTIMSNDVGDMTDQIFNEAELAGARPFNRGGFG